MEIGADAYRGRVDGKAVELYTLRNASGLVAKVTNWGARLVQLLVPGRDGRIDDVVLGYDTLEAAMAGQPSMGAFIGRYANRIANARFALDGIEHVLSANSGPHCLHGGTKGSRFVVFDAQQVDVATLVLRYTFRDGEEGFPGTVPLVLTCALTRDNQLVVAYEALAVDKATVVNFTPHGFFNLAGHGAGDVLAHELEVRAAHFLPVDAGLIPTGELRPVAGTPMDFTAPRAIGARIAMDDAQLRIGKGYDHHYALDRTGTGLEFAARVREPSSGRVMEVWTTEPGLQVYSGNHLEGKSPRDIGKGGAVYGPRTGFCLEPSHFPDSPNHPAFPTTVLRPGQRHSGRTVYRFN